MFSSQRREPIKKQVASRISAIATTTKTTTTTTQHSVSSPSSSRSPVPVSFSRPRPVVKVATVTRTTVVKKPPPPPPPRVLQRPPPPIKEKRKSETQKRDAPSKSRKLVARSSASRSRGLSDDEEGHARSEEEESSDEESSPVPTRTKARTVTPRDVRAVLDGATKCITSERLVSENASAYGKYFSDPSDSTKLASEWAGAEVPTVQLEYPGINASEKFILLAPKDVGNEYDPIEDLISTVRTVLDFFLTPAQSLSIFNHTAATTSFSAFLSAPPSRSGTPSTPNDTSTPIPTLPPLMRALEKAKARRDGPAFLTAVERYNDGLRTLKSQGTVAANIEAMKGVEEKVWMKIAGQSYERAVGPGMELLSKYAAFSSNTYGELLPKFVGEICQLTNLGPNSVFVDLGSGVGNCVVQAALATGCEAWGFENMAHASSLAQTQVSEAESRFRMWGLSSGKMHAVEADFCKSPDAARVLQRADVVLVNNEVFSSNLNESLSLLFLDLRQDTLIVSLKAFASSFTLSAHNQHSPLAILDQGSERHYNSKSVSWKSEGGTYYIGRIDRGLLEKFNAREKRRQEKAARRELAES